MHPKRGGGGGKGREIIFSEDRSGKAREKEKAASGIQGEGKKGRTAASTVSGDPSPSPKVLLEIEEKGRRRQGGGGGDFWGGENPFFPPCSPPR